MHSSNLVRRSRALFRFLRTCVGIKRLLDDLRVTADQDFPDCEDSRACSIHKSFTSSASFWESSKRCVVITHSAKRTRWGFKTKTSLVLGFGVFVIFHQEASLVGFQTKTQILSHIINKVLKCEFPTTLATGCFFKLRTPRNQDYKNKESTRRTVPVETSTSTALVSCDGLGGYDWSDQAEEGPNYALMAYSSSSSDSEVSNNSNCSKSCLKTVETLKSQYDQLHKDFKKSELMVLAYKSGLESVEEKLEVYKANESIYSQDIKVLKFEIECKDIAIRELRKKLEIAQKEKDGIQFNVDKFENASKSLNKLIESQIVDNCKKGLGYNAVPPPYTGNFMPPTPDLSFTGLDEFVNKPVVENRKSDEEVSKVVRKSNDSPIIKDWVSDSEEENVSQTKTEKKTVKPSIAKIEFVKPKQQDKTARKTVKQVEKHRQNTHSPRGNQRN
ncbi:hypothetical protein Tco_0146398 [Tanacetum coccineum]